MKYKIVTTLLSLSLAMSGMSVSAMACTGADPDQAAGSFSRVAQSSETLGRMTAASSGQKQVDLAQSDGRLMITEAGSYVLTGKLTGCVYVDPGAGDVELILDGVDIDGNKNAGIVAVSGDSLTVTLPEGSISRVTDGKADNKTNEFGAAIYSEVDTFFKGEGSLYITGGAQDSIHVQNADLTFDGGNYAIKGQRDAMDAERVTVNDGHFSVQAGNVFAPDARTDMNGGKIEETAPSNNGFGGRTDTSSDTAGQQPQMPGNSQQTTPTDSQQTTPADSQQPQMPGDSQQTAISSADSASEVVYGTMTNSAAELEADYENAIYITVTDDENEVVITSSGTYVVTGTCTDGNITVKKGTTGVILVLEDLDLTSTTGATVSVNKEAEVKIIISGNVVLTDNENPEDEESEDEEVADAFDGAALKVKADSQVYVTGDGTLVINGNAKNGIKAGDDSSLVFDGVTVNITAVNDGINSNYDLTLLSGTFNIAAGDDAIHADHILTVGSEDGTGPVIRVTESTEGLEGTVVNILGGDISIVSSDDAINAANGDGIYEGVLDYSVNMLGGKVVINAGGDGIDSNGDVNLIDGSAQITSSTAGGEAGIDYDGQLYVSDEFELNNPTGVSGADGMGQMPGQDMGQMPGQDMGQTSGQNTDTASGQSTNEAPAQNDNQAPAQNNNQPSGQNMQQGAPAGGSGMNQMSQRR